VNQWGTKGTDLGKFCSPGSIYYSLLEEMFYIGDAYSIQLFTKDGICLQRIGDKQKGNGMNQFNMVYAICLIRDQLYITDNENNRIQIFRRK